MHHSIRARQVKVSAMRSSTSSVHVCGQPQSETSLLVGFSVGLGVGFGEGAGGGGTKETGAASFLARRLFFSSSTCGYVPIISTSLESPKICEILL